MAHREELASDVAAARARHDPEVSSVYMGQGAGAVNAIRPAAEVVQQICADAEQLLLRLERTDALNYLRRIVRSKRAHPIQ